MPNAKVVLDSCFEYDPGFYLRFKTAKERAVCKRKRFNVRFIPMIWIPRLRTMTTFWERHWSTPSRSHKIDFKYFSNSQARSSTYCCCRWTNSLESCGRFTRRSKVKADLFRSNVGHRCDSWIWCRVWMSFCFFGGMPRMPERKRFIFIYFSVLTSLNILIQWKHELCHE